MMYAVVHHTSAWRHRIQRRSARHAIVKRVAPVAIATALVLLSAAVAIAHDTWLSARTNVAAVGDTIVLDLTSGESFPRAAFAIDPRRIRLSGFRLAGRRRDLTPSDSTAHALQFRMPAPHEGIATAWVSLVPRTLSLTDSLVDTYLTEIDADSVVRKRWADMPAPRRWREAYAKHAKTFIRVGAAAGDTSWTSPVGLVLEIAPLRDPTRLHAGDTLPIRVLQHGRPRAGFHVAAHHQGIDAFHTTDVNGRAAFVVGAPGEWLIRGTDLRPSSDAGLEWESDFTTLTLRVSPHTVAK